jgi:hypothetical protein
MKVFDWYCGRVRRVQQLSLRGFFLFLLAKVWGGVAIGILMASYISGINWVAIGWGLAVVSILLSLPVLPKIFRSQ